MTPQAVSLGVMSKAYGLAGLRVGWFATRDTVLLQRAAAFKDYLTICNSAPAEILALIALRNQERLLARSHEIIRSNLALLDAFFARWQEMLAWVRPLAGSVAFPRLRSDEPCIDAFVREVREQQGVLLLPGSVYDYPGDHFRIGFGRTTMPAALARLETFLAGMK
jgi:aspartate/methionine/tyrosine aminotransferase